MNLAVSNDSGRSFELVDTLGPGTAVGRVDLAANDRGFVLSWIDQADRSGVLVLAGYDWRGEQLWLERIESVDAGRASGFPRLGLLRGCRPVVAWTGRQGQDRRVRVMRIGDGKACDGHSRVDHSEPNP